MQCNIKRNEIHAKKNVRQADWQRALQFIPNNGETVTSNQMSFRVAIGNK